MIRVLLVAPLDPAVPGHLKFLMGGENTYTRNLLNFPPRGVEYVHYEEALKLGKIEYLAISRVLGILVKFRILPLSPGSKCFKLKERFDLVHCHIYSLKLAGAAPPVILSDSSSNYLFLKYYIHWHQWRIKIGYFFKKRLFDLLGVIDADTNLGSAEKLIVFSEFAKRIHLRLGAPRMRIEVIPAGLPDSGQDSGQARTNVARMTKEEINILFVGIWFERKGGPMVLEAFKKLSRKYPKVRLTIVGEVPEKYKLYSSSEGVQATESRSKRGSSRLRSNNIEQVDYVPRERLMREFFPKAHIFVIIPPVVEGFGFAVLEAMSFGIPVVVSNVCALPELVEDGESGFVVKPGSVHDFVEKLEILITNKTLREKMGQAAKKRFEERFLIEKSNAKLLEIYRKALLRGIS